MDAFVAVLQVLKELLFPLSSSKEEGNPSQKNCFKLNQNRCAAMKLGHRKAEKIKALTGKLNRIRINQV